MKIEKALKIVEEYIDPVDEDITEALDVVKAELDEAVRAAKIEGLRIARDIASGYMDNDATVDDINHNIKELENADED